MNIFFWLTSKHRYSSGYNLDKLKYIELSVSITVINQNEKCDAVLKKKHLPQKSVGVQRCLLEYQVKDYLLK